MSTQALEPPAGIAILREEPLARHTYMRVGGPAEYFATPADLDELIALLDWASVSGLRVRPLGGGSNIVVSDAGVRGLVVSLRRACGSVRFEGDRVHAGSGVMLPTLARSAAEHELSGLEFAIGIPGCVGGALQSNAGIGDGRDIGTLVERVEVLDGGSRHTLTHAEVGFDYRTTALRGSGRLVLEATLRLSHRPRTEIDQEMQRLLTARQASQPTAEPNAGSMFRNPAGDFAGRVIEVSGCKGLAVGAARVSTLHANFIVHDGRGTATEIVQLMADVQGRVRQQLGIQLVPEVEWWGEGPAPQVFSGAKMTGP